MSLFKRSPAPRPQLLLLICLSCCVAWPAFAQSTAETAIRQLVQEFFAAYQKRDVSALMSLWSETAPDREATGNSFRQSFEAAEKIEVQGLEILNLEVKGNEARVEVAAERVTTDAGGQPAARSEKINRVLRLAMESDGAWKVRRYASAEQELAAELFRLKTDGERKARLSEKKGLLNADLVNALFEEGHQAYDRGEFTEAFAVYSLGLTLAEQMGERDLISDGRRLIGNVHFARGDYAQALEQYQSSLKLSEELGEKRDIIGVSLNLGHIQAMQSNYSEALGYYQRALELAEQLEWKEIIANALMSIGNVYKAEGDYAQAMEVYQRSLKLAEEIKFTPLVGLLLNNIGTIYQSQNNAIQALSYYQRSLKLAEELGNKDSIAMLLLNIGGVHSSQGNYAQALEHYQRSLKISEEIGIKNNTARLLGNIGLAHQMQGSYEQALDFQRRALKLAEELNNKELLAGSLNNIGDVLAAQNKLDEALDYYRRSLEIAEGAKILDYTVQALGHVAETYLKMKKPEQALAHAERASTLASRAGLPGLFWSARATEGKAYLALNRRDAARSAFLEAINIIEKMRGDVAGGEEARARFFENKLMPYQAMIDLSIEDKDLALAFSYAERAKGRVLLEVLGSGRVNITKAMTRAELERDRALSAEIASLNANIAGLQEQPTPDEATLNQLRAQLEKARLSYESFQTNLYTSHPELKVQRGESKVMSLEEAAELLPDNESALIEYVVTEEKIYLFVITRDGGAAGGHGPKAQLSVHPIDVKSKEMAEMAERFRDSVASGDLTIKRPARQLYDLLIKPAESRLKGVKKLCLVPDGPLWHLPFQALYQGEKGYLLEQYVLFYAPSLSVLREMNRKGEGRTRGPAQAAAPAGPGSAPANTHLPVLLAVGNPSFSGETMVKANLLRGDETLNPLPHAEREVAAVGRMYGLERSRVLVENQAQEQTVKSEAGRYSILHFATHALLDDSNPMYSRIVLSRNVGASDEDGLLEAWEILKLDLNADLAVLSACQTARGRVGAGEGMIGISWAMFVAGTPAVVASQWKVESARTADLMIEFHRNLLQAGPRSNHGVAKAESLRRAALKLLHSPYNHPAYWAGFILVGSPR